MRSWRIAESKRHKLSRARDRARLLVLLANCRHYVSYVLEDLPSAASSPLYWICLANWDLMFVKSSNGEGGDWDLDNDNAWNVIFKQLSSSSLGVRWNPWKSLSILFRKPNLMKWVHKAFQVSLLIGFDVISYSLFSQYTQCKRSLIWIISLTSLHSHILQTTTNDNNCQRYCIRFLF